MKAISVNALPDYKLKVTFDDGIVGIIDLKNFIENGIFAELKNEQLFSKSYTTGYSIAWNDELEIDVITVYAEIVNKTSFIEKVERGLKDVEEGKVLEYTDAKLSFLMKNL